MSIRKHFYSDVSCLFQDAQVSLNGVVPWLLSPLLNLYELKNNSMVGWRVVGESSFCHQVKLGTKRKEKLIAIALVFSRLPESAELCLENTDSLTKLKLLTEQFVSTCF